VLLVLKFFVLIARGKAETQVAEADLSLVALLLELSVLKDYVAQRVGVVAPGADLVPDQDLAVILAKHDADVGTIDRGHDQSRERAPSLARGNSAGLLLSPLLEPSLDTLWRTEERTTRLSLSTTDRLAVHARGVAEVASTRSHLATWVKAHLGVKAKPETQSTATGV
jgi:hypothetical protein